MKNIRRYLTQNISLDRIQTIFDLGIQDRIVGILREPGYDELKVIFADRYSSIAMLSISSLV